MLTPPPGQVRDIDRRCAGVRAAYSRTVRRGGTLAVVVTFVIATLAVPAAASERSAKAATGGEVVWGLDAETPEGWCLPASQLAASGIIVSNAIYDTL